MSLIGILVRGGLKTGEKVGGSKKRVHFSDEGPVNLEDTPRLLAAVPEYGQDVGVATTDTANSFPFDEKGPGLAEMFAKASITCDTNSHTMVDIRQLGASAEGKLCLTEETKWSSSTNALEKAACDNDDGEVKKSMSPSSTPPSGASYGVSMWDNADHGKALRVKGVQRKLTFAVGAGDQQMSRKYGFTSRKAQAKMQNVYKVVPEREGAFSTDFLPVHVNGTHAFAFPAEGACKKRCAWITAHSDAVYVTYHDEEWGVPVHDDRRLFELLVFAGAQSEITWSSILTKREAYRDSFAQFDPAILATYDTPKTMLIKSQHDTMKSEARIQSIMSNAKVVMKIVEEFGSFSDYLWGFVSYKPIVSNYKQAKSIPMRTAKSEAISKDLQRRGMRHAGPLVIYSFMQAAGLANDHLVSCFRHPSTSPSSPSAHSLPPLPPTKPLISRPYVINPI